MTIMGLDGKRAWYPEMYFAIYRGAAPVHEKRRMRFGSCPVVVGTESTVSGEAFSLWMEIDEERCSVEESVADEVLGIAIFAVMYGRTRVKI